MTIKLIIVVFDTAFILTLQIRVPQKGKSRTYRNTATGLRAAHKLFNRRNWLH
jgi:hypothetical protein